MCRLSDASTHDASHALRWPSVANTALRIRLDLQLAPPRRDRYAATTRLASLKRAPQKGLARAEAQHDHQCRLACRRLILIVAPFSSRLSRYTYTRAIVAAVPIPRVDQNRGALPINGHVGKGHVGDARNPPSGCRFHDHLSDRSCALQ
jgi:hypothetical protein